MDETALKPSLDDIRRELAALEAEAGALWSGPTYVGLHIWPRYMHVGLVNDVVSVVISGSGETFMECIADLRGKLEREAEKRRRDRDLLARTLGIEEAA